MCTHGGAGRLHRCIGVVVLCVYGLLQSPPAAADDAAVRLESARAALRRGDARRAVDEYAATIASIEARGAPNDVQLIEPLRELADAQATAGRPREAIQTLQRAAALARRDGGLYDPRLSAVLLRLVDLQTDAADLEAATEALLYLERLADKDAARSRGAALTKIAQWHCRIGRFDDGRRLHRKAVEAILAASDDDRELADALLIAPICCLHELSAEGVATAPGVFEQYRGAIQRSNRLSPESPAFRFHSLKALRGAAETALVRAVRLSERTADRKAHVNMLVFAGDWFQMKDHSRAARRYYARAEALSRGDLEQPLATPVLLLYPIPELALERRFGRRGETQEKAVEVEVTVHADGRVDGERVLNREAGKSAVDETLIALRVARFRPRLENGVAVDVRRVLHRQAF